MSTSESSSSRSSQPASVWVTGAGGLIGHALTLTAAEFMPGFRIIPLTRALLDLTDIASVQTAFQRQKPTLIIHCAAMSRSPACEADPAAARLHNVEVTRTLADLAKDIPFVFFSTDLVFDGQQGHYLETDRVNPLSVYAETKVTAETFILQNPRHTVIRTSLNGGTSPTGDRGFNEQMRKGWAQGQRMKLFVDEFRCPIAAVATARATWELARFAPPGLYHVAGSERMSRLRLGELLAARWPELHPVIEPGSLKDYSGAPRAPDTSMDCTKAQSYLKFPLPAFSKWLADHPEERF